MIKLCFLRCILAYLYPVEDHKKTSNYSMYMIKFNLKGLEFHMKVTDIPKFENSNNLNVNVFELTGTASWNLVNTNLHKYEL